MLHLNRRSVSLVTVTIFLLIKPQPSRTQTTSSPSNTVPVIQTATTVTGSTDAPTTSAPSTNSTLPLTTSRTGVDTSNQIQQQVQTTSATSTLTQVTSTTPSNTTQAQQQQQVQTPSATSNLTQTTSSPVTREDEFGRCVKKQCSWPHGMSCVPSKPTSVYLLRWHCKSRGGKKARRGTDSSLITCKWLKFRYPVIHQCDCKCEKKLETDSENSGELLPHNLLQGN